MNNPAQPVTTALGDVDPNRAPRTVSHEQMHQHQANGLATVLSQRERYRMFVRYDNVWWISDHHGYVEITSGEQNSKLDRWHERLAQGALWI